MAFAECRKICPGFCVGGGFSCAHRDVPLDRQRRKHSGVPAFERLPLHFAPMKNIVILISGRGSNMESIVRASAAQGWPARVVAVISNRPEAVGLAVARRLGVSTRSVDHTQYAAREAFDADLAHVIDTYAPDLVLLAGFMRVLTPGFVQHYAGRLVNIHPSLLPEFPGLNTHRRALEAGRTETGATVHMVTGELDAGTILDQVRVPVLPGDTPQVLAQRVLEQEHVLYPRAIRRLIEETLA